MMFLSGSQYVGKILLYSSTNLRVSYLYLRTMVTFNYLQSCLDIQVIISLGIRISKLTKLLLCCIYMGLLITWWLNT